MTILISYFLRFGALNILTGVYFVLRIYQILYSKQKFDALLFSIFSSTFLQVFPIHFVQARVRTSGVWIELHISK